MARLRCIRHKVPAYSPNGRTSGKKSNRTLHEVLDLFTPFTWNRFQEHGANITGFRPRQRIAAFERVEPGDNLLCYLVKLSRWCGVLEVASEAFEDNTPIFAEANDPFPIR